MKRKRNTLRSTYNSRSLQLDTPLKQMTFAMAFLVPMFWGGFAFIDYTERSKERPKSIDCSIENRPTP